MFPMFLVIIGNCITHTDTNKDAPKKKTGGQSIKALNGNCGLNGAG